MLVIGLAGGTGVSREAVAEYLRMRGRQRLAVWNQPGRRLTDSRARTLARALEQDGTADPVEVLVVVNVLTEEEAEVIRARGGEIWHVFGPVSSAVVIRPGDPLVTEQAGGDRHWLDPIEALSESLLRRPRGAA